MQNASLIDSGAAVRWSVRDFVWALGSLCALHRIPFSADLLAREFPGEPSAASLIQAGRKFGFKVKQLPVNAKSLSGHHTSLLVALRTPSPDTDTQAPFKPSLSIVTGVDDASRTVSFFTAGSSKPSSMPLAEFAASLTGDGWLFAAEVEPARDDGGQDASTPAQRKFGFRWFVPELLRYRKVWRDVLFASLALQLVSLATPLFTQAIVDKVVVHRTESTLIAIGIAMAIFIVFNAVLGWGRQYLVLHTGNRVDAVLGASVWEHLLKLPAAYFHHRSTGVVAARLHAVETIREFVSGAAVSLVLDLPFLVICLGVMFWYSAMLTAICVAMLGVIAIASFLVAPVFRARLDEQFLLGARNQAFLTEHIAGFETVKSLQMEPQLRKRYSGYLATYLASGFRTKQIGNTYNTFANAMEQAMTLLVLTLGAWTVMTEPRFTIGMLVAFQMFAGKLSQPVLRIVSLWTNFQQASMSVQRLGDVMNAPAEPYSIVPQRQNDGNGRLDIQGLAFRYGEDRPLLYKGLDLKIEPGQTIAIMGASGTGKSTFAKLLLGFYQPTQGSIRIDGIDIRNLTANELRAWFGVVPQDTTLFTGTILGNLQAGNPNATLDEAAQACRMAGVHETIEALPQGYQTEIGERGIGLSGGQKQRLAIARALLKRPKILIFDEATSALDQETAEAFARTIDKLRGKVTILFISHNVPRSLNVDAVLKIERDGVHQFHVVAPQKVGLAGEER